jgi:hypothetical protein
MYFLIQSSTIVFLFNAVNVVVVVVVIAVVGVVVVIGLKFYYQKLLNKESKFCKSSFLELILSKPALKSQRGVCEREHR